MLPSTIVALHSSTYHNRPPFSNPYHSLVNKILELVSQQPKKKKNHQNPWKLEPPNQLQIVTIVLYNNKNLINRKSRIKRRKKNHYDNFQPSTPPSLSFSSTLPLALSLSFVHTLLFSSHFFSLFLVLFCMLILAPSPLYIKVVEKERNDE